MLFLLFNIAKAGRQFGTFSSVMRHASTTYSVPWTVLRAGAIDVIMRAHNSLFIVPIKIATYHLNGIHNVIRVNFNTSIIGSIIDICKIFRL